MSHLLITNPAKILEEMVALFASFDIDGIEEASGIYTDRGYSGISLLINDGIQWKSFLEEFCREWDASMFPNPDGSVGIKVLNWGTETAEVTLIADAIDYESFEYEPDRSNIVVEFQRFYDYNPRTKIYLYNPADVSADTGHRGTKEPFYGKYHTDSATFKDVVSRTQFLLKVPSDRYKFKVLPQYGQEIDVGMVIEAPLPGGPNTDTRLLWVFSKKVTDTGDILRVLDISTINEGLIILYADADPLIYLLTDVNPRVLI